MKIGVDIGGSRIKAGIVDKNRIIKKIEVYTPKTRKEFLKKLVSVIKYLDSKKNNFIGVGCPGPADYKKGVIWKTPNVPLSNFNLLKFLKSKFKGKRIVIDNDANCFVLGEALKLKEKIVVGLTLGTGVGGGIVVNKKIFSGKGNAGELGRCIIEVNGITGKDKIKGSLEGYISGDAVKRNLGKTAQEMSDKEWGSYGMYVGIGLATLNNVLDPDIIVLGGGITRSYRKFEKSMKKELKKRSINKLPKIIIGKEYSGIFGAANLG